MTDLTLGALLGRGYLPEELPPVFCSRTLGEKASELQAAWADLPGHVPRTKPAVFNLARTGTLRRRLSIPNPVHHIKVADLICEHWSEIDDRLSRSELCISRPVPDPSASRRATRTQVEFRSLPDHRARVRAAQRHILRADVAQFYPSIYTHSLEWAFHGKSQAKAALTSKPRKKLVPGGPLDEAIRNGQHGQTMGLPIGPNTSHILAEVVLAEIDADFQTRFDGPLRGFRYMDDYELGFARLSDAERALGALQEALSEFELHLNPRKTSITTLPTLLDSHWTAILRGMTFREGPRNQRRDLLRLFDLTVSLSAQYPNENVHKFALGILRYVPVLKENWHLVQHWLMQCLLVEPGTHTLVLDRIRSFANEPGFEIDRDILHTTLKRVILDHISPGHSSEVAWALWGCLEFQLALDDDVCRLLIRMDDPIVALLCLLCQARGLWASSVDMSSLNEHASHEALYGRSWLLAYEGMRRGWLEPQSSGDELALEPRFGTMARLGIRFMTIGEPSQLSPRLQVEPAFSVPGGE